MLPPTHCIPVLSSLLCWDASRSTIWLLTLSRIRNLPTTHSLLLSICPFFPPPIPITHFLSFFLPESKCKTTSKAYTCYTWQSLTGQLNSAHWRKFWVTIIYKAFVVVQICLQGMRSQHFVHWEHRTQLRPLRVQTYYLSKTEGFYILPP